MLSSPSIFLMKPRKGIIVDIDGLSAKLGVPVIGTVARSEKGLDRLKETVEQIVNKK